MHVLINAYLKERGETSPKASLFCSLAHNYYGKRLPSSTVSHIVKDAMRAAGYDSPRLVAHSLRHTAATTALKSGASLRETQQMLRHKNVAVTQVYHHELSEIENQATNINADKFGI